MEAAGEDHVVAAAGLGPEVFTARPHRVMRDTGGELVLAYWPGSSGSGSGPLAQEAAARPPEVGGPVPVLPPDALAVPG
jgi:hypothetical protein